MDTAAHFALTDTEHLDVLIVGAGLSGIGAAWHLQKKCPGKSFAILEAREASGGTWDLFRYPGVRSDSDMYTLGYSFRPWKEAKAIADGPSILTYIREVARDHGIDERIRYGYRVVAASWSTPDARWTVEVETGPDRIPRRFTCNFLWMCSGYYDYAAGYLPEFAGMERFGGRIVHPQKWTDDIDYAGKRVVVIGSGATAVTLVPAMAEKAEHVTMLQRSPTYMVARPSQDALANKLRRRLPIKLAYAATRWRNVLLGMYFYQMCKRKPDKVKSLLLGGVRQMLGPDYDIDTHFTPRYNPWDQRLCLVPDGDLFNAIKEKRASVVTREIDTFTKNGIRLKDGSELEADIIVIDYDQSTITANAGTDSLGNRVGYPLFKNGTELYETRDMVYNFKTKKAKISEVVTKQNDGFLHGKTVYKSENNELYSVGNGYTTCNLAHPHFRIVSTKIKAIPAASCGVFKKEG